MHGFKNKTEYYLYCLLKNSQLWIKNNSRYMFAYCALYLVMPNLQTIHKRIVIIIKTHMVIPEVNALRHNFKLTLLFKN